MMSGGLMNDVKDSHQSLKNMIQALGELQNEVETTDDFLESMIHYNVNDVLCTPLPRTDYVKIQIDDTSEDTGRNAAVHVRNFTREMDYGDVKNVLLDCDGNVDIGDMFHYFKNN